MHPRSLFTSRPHLLRKDVVSCGHAWRPLFASSSTHPRPNPHTPSIDARSHVLTYDMYSHTIPSGHTRPHPRLCSIRTKIPIHTTTPTHAIHSHQDPQYHGRPRAHTSSIHTKTSSTYPRPHQHAPPIHTKTWSTHTRPHSHTPSMHTKISKTHIQDHTHARPLFPPRSHVFTPHRTHTRPLFTPRSRVLWFFHHRRFVGLCFNLLPLCLAPLLLCSLYYAYSQPARPLRHARLPAPLRVGLCSALPALFQSLHQSTTLLPSALSLYIYIYISLYFYIYTHIYLYIYIWIHM